MEERWVQPRRETTHGLVNANEQVLLATSHFGGICNYILLAMAVTQDYTRESRGQ
ncbi:MAG: hypothetical protein JWP57_3852 [Spirosoma sp.]|nr:hypothetical protein [Spirosoma sp.]